MGLKWYGPSVMAKIQAGFQRNLAAASIIVLNHARQLISIAGTAMVATGKGKRTKRVYNANPSKPGEPPHKQRGHLRRMVQREVQQFIARVGTNYKVGRWLEQGTRTMAARPWLKRALMEMLGAVRAALGRPIK
jgi:3-oxoacyl-[acyl-carrier-protein] synthase III